MNLAYLGIIFSMCVAFLKITTSLWVILTFHPGYTSIILEIATIKLGGQGPRANQHMEVIGEGQEKQITVIN